MNTLSLYALVTFAAILFRLCHCEGLGVSDTTHLVLKDCADSKVLFVPGHSFIPGGGGSTHVRASYVCFCLVPLAQLAWHGIDSEVPLFQNTHWHAVLATGSRRKTLKR